MEPQAHNPQQPSAGESAPLREETAAAIAEEGYSFGYPLVLMDATRRVMTAVAKPDATRAPANQFNVSQAVPDASFTDVVSPNVDTLYSVSWLDLSDGPIVLNLPEADDRYYVMQLLDAWTNVFAAPGTRTTGNRPGHYAIVGPGWQGVLPAGVYEINSPTTMVWLIGRTQTNGPSDYEAVRELTAKYRLVPLSAWRKPYTPPEEVMVDPTVTVNTPPAEQVARMTADEFFSTLARLMEENPPAPDDAPMLERLARIGVSPSAPFDPSRLPSEIDQAIDHGVATARSKLAAQAPHAWGQPVRGWNIALGLGHYGTDYSLRAAVALLGLGANLAEDAVYPIAHVDEYGQPLSGEHSYRIHFEAGDLPPVDAFWSITLYDAQQHLVANAIDRYALGDRDALQHDEDGGVTLYVQHASPGKGHERNWLPAPEGAFNLIMRLYQPRAAIIDGSWQPPPVQIVH